MAKKKKISKKLKEFSIETRFKSSNEFKEKILQMFKGYVKAIVVWGSITRGDYTGKSDVDIYVIFDDTKMPLKKFNSIRERVTQDMYKVAKSIDPRLHPQPVIALTEFYQNIRACNPFIYNIVREGYAIYDVGFFVPMRKLMEKGEFPVTPEAAELRMELVPKRIRRVKQVKLLMVVDDLYQAMVDSVQAVIMYLGFAPPAPKILVRDTKRYLVDAGLVDKKYAELLDKMVTLRKASEKKDVKSLTGKQVDEWIKKTEDFVNEMEKTLKKIEIGRKEETIKKNYEVMLKASVAALKAMKKLPKDPKNLPSAFKKELIDSGLVNPIYGDVLGQIVQMRKMIDDKKLDMIPERDVYRSKEYVKRFIVEVRSALDRIPEEKPKPAETQKKSKKTAVKKKTNKKSSKKVSK